MSLNVVILAGNLGRDSELRHTASGLQVLEFSVCVNQRKKIDGEWTDEPNWFDCIMFGKRAETVAAYLKKGTGVTIQGRLEQSKWETSDGQKRSRVRVIVEGLEINSRPQTSEKPGVYSDENIPF